MWRPMGPLPMELASEVYCPFIRPYKALDKALEGLTQGPNKDLNRASGGLARHFIRPHERLPKAKNAF